ncbi:ubiquinol-cytochrome c reductase iron-sulfur subunit N-terminal domain-containing protein, partial [Brevundimonas sp. UBA5718]|uniref:ubiquinol-cytochrome c reductase iron-sulfur subunit N-terminal domain-containing protein n=1 Tax=Brevundimonas sp. UBA5718 TaxID=1946131 RepID=UPI0039C88E27
MGKSRVVCWFGAAAGEALGLLLRRSGGGNLAESVVHTQDSGNPESGDPNRRDFIYIAAGAAAVG